MSDKETLLSMGFAPERIDWALKATKRAGLQPAMDHILANAENPVPSAEELAAEDAEALNSAVDGLEEAKSIKCSDCGKMFRSQATASFHAEKSGHENFEESTEEIKPLTEEEKAAKLAELRARLAEKRAVQGKEDATAAKANEALRRKAGQDQGLAREELLEKQMAKEAEQKRRDKIEDQRARAAVKAQIEADKRERAAKAAAEKALRDGSAPAVPVPATVAAPAAAAAAAAASGSAAKSSDNPETRLQIRLHVGGAPLVKAFPSENTLVDVAEFVASQNLAYSVDTVVFATMHPRKTYSRDEMRKSLKANGLTPSAVLMANVQ